MTPLNKIHLEMIGKPTRNYIVDWIGSDHDLSTVLYYAMIVCKNRICIVQHSEQKGICTHTTSQQ